MWRTAQQIAFKALRKLALPVVTAVSAPRRRRTGLVPPRSRARFLARVPTSDALEIGPFANPVLTGPGVAYFDVLDTSALRERARSLGMDPARTPSIDYVSPTGDLAVIDRQFAAVFSSHAVEHQPDLVAHLTAVERLLRPGGRYYLLVPDKRFTFDHFIAASTIDEVIAAHRERRRVHHRDSVVAHWLAATHNSPMHHWLGMHGRPFADEHRASEAEREAALADRGDYIDVHAWRFSPASFRSVVQELGDRGLTGLRPLDVADTAFADLEFSAVLGRD